MRETMNRGLLNNAKMITAVTLRLLSPMKKLHARIKMVAVTTASVILLRL
jgi:hypothetical protein